MKEPKPLTQSAHYTGVAAEVPVVKESTTSRVIHNNPLLRVVEYLARWQPAQIRCAVLVDRGVARLPVHADVLGVRLDVAPSDIIECNVPPYEPTFKVDVLQPHALRDGAPAPP